MNKESGITISGSVVHGKKYGKALGFPTANLDRRSFSRRRMRVRLGVWAGIAQVSPPPNLPHHPSTIARGDPERSRSGQGGGNLKFPSLEGRGKGRVFKSAIVIGPLDRSGLPKIEAHLLGFKGNLYGKKIVLTLGKYVRAFRRFKDEEGLKAQIKKDIGDIKKLRY